MMSLGDAFEGAGAVAESEPAPVSEKNLSERQQRILWFIREYIELRGFAPANRDIQAGLGISSTSVVDYNLTRLEFLGHIRREVGVARSIRLLTKDGAGLEEHLLLAQDGAFVDRAGRLLTSTGVGELVVSAVKGRPGRVVFVPGPGHAT